MMYYRDCFTSRPSLNPDSVPKEQLVKSNAICKRPLQIGGEPSSGGGPEKS